MSACAEQFGSLVQAGPLRLKNYQEFLFQAEVAFPGYRVESPSFTDNFPTYIKRLAQGLWALAPLMGIA